MEKEVWNDVIKSNSIFSKINENMLLMQSKYPASLPNFKNSTSLIITSDYSGELKKSAYQVYSFLITDINGCLKWNKSRELFRHQYFTDNRRISFKNLNDSQRRNALIPFLNIANKLMGLSFSVAIDNSIDTLFDGPSPLDLKNPDFQDFISWKPKVLEKAFRILHFVSFFISGFSSEGQNVLWFSDEDDIAANDERLAQLTNIFSYVATGYLTHNLGHLRCGTTKNDDGSLLIEDLAAIPDLIAGSINEQMTLIENNPNLPEGFWVLSPEYSKKTASITFWLSETKQPLKRLFCVLKPISGSQKISVSWFHFHDQY